MAVAAGCMATGRRPPRRARRQRAAQPALARRLAGMALAFVAATAVLTLAIRVFPLANGPATGASAPSSPQVAAAAAGCAPTVGGAIGAQDRIRVTAELTGPDGTQTLPVLIDTGTQETVLPASVLLALGYRPLPGTITIQGVTGQMEAERFLVASPAVADGEGWLSLGSGRLTVLGVASGAGTGSPDALLGLDVLKGADLQISGGRWQMTGACTAPAA